MVYVMMGAPGRKMKVKHGGRRKGACISMLSRTYPTKNLPVHLPYYLNRVSPLEDSLRGSLPGENMGPM